MKKPCLISDLLFALVFASGALQCQQLTVQTDSGKRVVLTCIDLEALPHVMVTATDHSSSSANFEGVTLKSVLQKAGVQHSTLQPFVCETWASPYLKSSISQLLSKG